MKVRTSIERQWQTAALATLGSFALLIASLSYLLGEVGTRFGAEGWLSASTASSRMAVDEALVDRLTLSTQLLSKSPGLTTALHAGDESAVRTAGAGLWHAGEGMDWFAVDPAGRALVEPPCPSLRQRIAQGPSPGYALCGRTQYLLHWQAVPGGGVLGVAYALGDSYIARRKRIGGCEVLVIDAQGTTVSTARDLDGKPAVVSLPAALRTAPVPQQGRFGIGYIAIPRYGGFPVQNVAAGADGFDAAYFVAPLGDPALGQLVVHFAPIVLIKQGINYSTLGMVAGTLLMACGFALLTRSLARRFTKPILELANASEQIAAGNYAVRTTYSGGNELAQLSANFQQMADTLAETQERLAQSRKMAAVGQLAAGFAHEINNPIAVILGFAQGMARRMKPSDPLELPIQSIVREAGRVRALVSDMLQFSRSQRGTLSSQDLDDVVRSTMQRLRDQSPTAVLRDDLQSAATVLASRLYLEQIVENIVKNAIDASNADGEVVVKTHTEGSRCRIEISDQGSGIPEDVLPRIFDPFFTTKDPGKGTGLGLALVYDLVQKCKGEIRVQTKRGQGTTFIVDLPREAAEVASAAAPGSTGDRMSANTKEPQ